MCHVLKDPIIFLKNNNNNIQCNKFKFNQIILQFIL